MNVSGFLTALHLPDGEYASLYGRVTFSSDGKITASRAFSVGERVSLLLFLPRALGTLSATLELYEESGTHLLRTVPLSFLRVERDSDVYTAGCPADGCAAGLYFFKFTVDTVTGRLFTRRVGDRLSLTRDAHTPPDLQLTIYERDLPAPDFGLGGVIYQIFVDRYAKGGNVPVRPGAVMMRSWDDVPEYPAYPGAPLRNNTFFGGTLYGITEHLDDIAALGTTYLYLSPVFESPSNHKYDTGDYETVDAMFGGEAALRLLISEAEKRNIRVILDGVFNHTGADSKYFNKEGHYPTLGAYQSLKSPYASWYHFDHFPDRYTCWWGIDILPRIHPDVPSCGEYFTGAGGIVERYAAMGIGGFRLDVVDELSDDFIGKIRRALTGKNKEALLYGEVWEDASSKIAYGVRKKYYLGGELDGVMNYPLRTGILSWMLGEGCEKLRYALTDVIENAPKEIRDRQMNLLGTHDTERVLSLLGAPEKRTLPNDELAAAKLDETERKTAVSRLTAAYTLVATLPGMPMIFYGDEAGVEGYRDPFNRRTYPWGHENTDLLSHYRNIGALRTAHPVYRRGAFRLLYLDDSLLLFLREGEGEQLLTAVNIATHEVSVATEKISEDLLSGKVLTAHHIPACAATVIDLKENKTIKFTI